MYFCTLVRLLFMTLQCSTFLNNLNYYMMQLIFDNDDFKLESFYCTYVDIIETKSHKKYDKDVFIHYSLLLDIVFFHLFFLFYV